MSDVRRLRMFPLGTVLFPRGVLPLHIFEPRYLQMISEAVDDDGTFGVTLIERGSEVGGGDQRFGVGTVARIVRVGEIDETRLAIVTVGGSRIRVVEWLDDDPYPAALVEEFPDGSATDELIAVVGKAKRTLRRLLALASELGADVGNADIEWPEDATDAAWSLCSVAPIEQIDRQTLLEIEDPGPRVILLQEYLDDLIATLEMRLAAG